MKANGMQDEDKLDLIGLRLGEIQTIADLLTNSVGEDGEVAGGAMLIRRLAGEAHDALVAAIEEVNRELRQAKGGAA